MHRKLVIKLEIYHYSINGFMVRKMLSCLLTLLSILTYPIVLLTVSPFSVIGHVTNSCRIFGLQILLQSLLFFRLHLTGLQPPLLTGQSSVGRAETV